MEDASEFNEDAAQPFERPVQCAVWVRVDNNSVTALCSLTHHWHHVSHYDFSEHSSARFCVVLNMPRDESYLVSAAQGYRRPCGPLPGHRGQVAAAVAVQVHRQALPRVCPVVTCLIDNASDPPPRGVLGSVNCQWHHCDPARGPRLLSGSGWQPESQFDKPASLS
eukprot:2374402-Rhodomonas_salina.4